MFRYLVLGLLRNGLPQHGYALTKAYRERIGIQINTGNFYRELAKLTASGLVRTSNNPDGADQRRAPYQITEAGMHEFDLWLTSPAGDSDLGESADEVSAKAIFLSETEPAITRRILGLWQEDLWLRSKHVERRREAALLRGRSLPREFPILSLLLARRLKRIAADLEFVDELRLTYEEWTKPTRPQAPLRRQPLPSQLVAARRSAAK